MSSQTSHQQPDLFNPAIRKERQGKGQFWTPQWVARAMVRYLARGGIHSFFDPAVGAGAFFKAAKAIGEKDGFAPSLLGTELYAQVLVEARAAGLTDSDLAQVVVADFMKYQFLRPPPGIVANPPYLRHHKIGAGKEEVQNMAKNVVGEKIDGRAGLHVYFLIKALDSLSTGGRLAFIMPADTCEGAFSGKLWQWITNTFCLDAVVTFIPEATPFPGVDTNAVVLFIRKDRPTQDFTWARWKTTGESLEQWVEQDFPIKNDAQAEVVKRTIEEGLRSGLSRRGGAVEKGKVLGDLARVVRGIATGDNDYFFLTSAEVKKHALPARHLVRAVGRTRDVIGDTITAADLARLDKALRPTYLLYLNDTPQAKLPKAVQAYLNKGKKRGVDKGILVATRGVWYKMERREAPIFLFAYLGRSGARFIKNEAKARPLTGFLCVYPKDEEPEMVAKLWKALSDPATVANLIKVGKSYGDGSIKVEPRALERLLIPEEVLIKTGLL